ncbi:class I SAM-dependent methyltransferase [Brevibacterium album]|uniref:class I SAM-dependent methyltransferase n=1 Tax=Brevibacterium album TaxID=417948 RepID=UPI00040F9B77|nr:class I SAM-dependent methyltransferase [Brevibacterium album]
MSGAHLGAVPGDGRAKGFAEAGSAAGAGASGAVSGGGSGHGNLWTEALARDPEHSRNYARRWRRMVEAGQDIDGEARFADAMAERESKILDAGCGTGRTGGWLSERGHAVVGVDLDPHLVEVARQDFPAAEWHVGDLARMDLREPWGSQKMFDLVVMAGNVMTFVATDERVSVLERIRAHMFDDARFVCGFGAGRGYAFEDFFADAEAAGLRLSLRLGTWDIRPASEDFLVAVLQAR